jgi:hypothetical protein
MKMKTNDAINELARSLRDAQDTSETTIRCALNDMVDDEYYAQDRAVKRVRKLIHDYRRLK